MSKKISIIIPVYNTPFSEFEKCINSLLKDLSDDVEVLIINDGSTNGIQAIISKYTSNFIKVFNTSNHGVAAARNFGIKMAEGERISFIDPDDFVTNDYIKNLIFLVNNFGEYDFVCFDYNILTKNKIKKFNLLSSSQDISYLKTELTYGSFGNLKIESKRIAYESNVIWNKLFKRDFLEKNRILFPENCKKGEDVLFCAKLYLDATKIFYYKKILYNYVRHLYSVTNRFNPNIVEDNAISYSFYRELIIKYKLPHIYNELLYNREFTRLYSYSRLYFFNVNNKKSYKNKMNEFIAFVDSEYFKNVMNNISFNLLSLKEKTFYVIIKTRLFFLIYLYFKF